MTTYTPEKDSLLLFDGVCHLCNGTVNFLARADRGARLKFASIQSDLGRALYAQHGLDPERPQSMLLITPGGACTESEAFLKIAWTLGGVWRLAALGQLVPSCVRDAAYRFIARRRRSLFPPGSSCQMPNPALQARLVGKVH